MYNDPQGSYPPPDPQWGGNGNANNGAQNSYLPQNPAPQWGENGTANVQQGPYPSTQNFTPQWGNGTANFQQGPYPPQNPAPVQPNFVYATPSTPSRRSGLISSQSAPKNNLSMIMIGGATALALIVGLALFVGLSSQGQKSSTPVVQTSVATPAATPDTATPTPEATATPMPTPTVVATPTTASNTTASTYAPPPAVQQPAPVPTPMPVAPTPTPKPTATVAPITFTYDYNPVNGILLTNPPANFCAAGQAAQTAGVQCVADFATNAGGYVVTCRDGIHVSHNGGKGACAGKPYGGEGRKWYEHQVKK